MKRLSKAPSISISQNLPMIFVDEPSSPNILCNDNDIHFFRDTISHFDQQEIIFSIGSILCYHMRENSRTPQREIDNHNILHKIFNDPNFNNVMINKATSPEVSLKYVIRFLKNIFQITNLNIECYIITLILINRYISRTNIYLNAGNWRLLVITSVIITSKFWNNQENKSFLQTIHHFFPTLSFQHIYFMEENFLNYLQKDLSCSRMLYAKYYYELRDISIKHHQNNNTSVKNKKKYLNPHNSQKLYGNSFRSFSSFNLFHSPLSYIRTRSVSFNSCQVSGLTKKHKIKTLLYFQQYENLCSHDNLNDE